MVNKDEYIKTDEEQLNSRNALLMVKTSSMDVIKNGRAIALVYRV